MTTNSPIKSIKTDYPENTTENSCASAIAASCGHTARGTSGSNSRLQWCQSALKTRSSVYAGPATIPCRPGRGLEDDFEYVSRGYCDNCIMAGIALTKAKGLTDIDTYARSMGVSVNDLMRANPQWRP